MSTWDERAMERANLFYPPPPDGETGLTYPLEALRDGKRDAFMMGASWRQEQLLTDETIERAARALYEMDVADASAEPWPTFHDGMNDMYRERARAALMAVIGGPK